MDSAESEQLLGVLQAQESHIPRQEEFQAAMVLHIGHLSSQLQGTVDQLARLTATATVPTLPMPFVGAASQLAPPEQYTGEPRRFS